MTSRSELSAYRRRWEAVREVERQELRTASVELRWIQLNSIVGLAKALGLLQKMALDRDDRVVRERWVRLKEKA